MIDTVTSEFPLLETEHLILREVNVSDAKAVFQVFSDREVTQYHDLEPPTQVEQVKGLINRWSIRFNSKQGIRWGIAQKTNNVIIGSCGLTYKGSFLAEVGYELAKPYWRQGIMTEALSAVLEFGFQTDDLNRIQAMVMLNNMASVSLLKKLGFLEEGILREYGYWKGTSHDLRILSLLKRDYLFNQDFTR
ncbi:GNAT family N-acetyltransferase [Oculatella sp. LEGE 06141]|uniref:GNAT family N-acetyltransferase n=1 Tax=Oculatella sp. LEGE 06141 TaxID=1828648 RepID=UPI00187F6CED|nr:GNAT family protein [Oculatella sp. LEGE 06141]MBE9179408.1 GNAT family N-acetyltransferase [Oculatella sp. LEGE 06141]